MEIDVRQRRNQRNKRRERAQRMQAERGRDNIDGGGTSTIINNNLQNNNNCGAASTGNGTTVQQSNNITNTINNNINSTTTATVTNTNVREADDSADEDMDKTPVREKPPPRRKKPKEQSPLLEEDIVDGFAILAFKTYEDLEVSFVSIQNMEILFPGAVGLVCLSLDIMHCLKRTGVTLSIDSSIINNWRLNSNKIPMFQFQLKVSR